MKSEIIIEQLLGWRTALAENEAPPAPRASRLLERARPWWQRRPEIFDLMVAAFERTPVRLGHAMEPGATRGGSHPVPTVIARTNVETNLLADILYLAIRGNTLRLRFQLHPMTDQPEADLEVTFVADDGPHPLFSTVATLAPGQEYRLEVEIPAQVARVWKDLRVTDRMPFRFVLRPADEA